MSHTDHLVIRVEELEERVKTLEDVLSKYGRHDLTCPCSYFSVGHVCECGLKQALAAKEPKA